MVTVTNGFVKFRRHKHVHGILKRWAVEEGKALTIKTFDFGDEAHTHSTLIKAEVHDFMSQRVLELPVGLVRLFDRVEKHSVEFPLRYGMEESDESSAVISWF